jgi:streptogramin lyase
MRLDSTTSESRIPRRLRFLLAALLTLAAIIAGPISSAAASDYQPVAQWPITNPAYAAIDAAGNLYFTTATVVEKFSPNGDMLATFGSGVLAGAPRGVGIGSNGDVYVVDVNAGNVAQFDPSGNLIRRFGSFISYRGPDPSGLGIDSAGNVYVTEYYNYVIQKFDTDGNYVRSYDMRAIMGDNWAYDTNDIVIDPAGNLYVTDIWGGRVDKISNDGNLVTTWGGLNSATPFQFPGGIPYTVWAVALGPDGHVFVTDETANEVYEFTSGGALVDQFGGSGSGPGELSFPLGVRVDNAGNVYAGDYYNNRIQKFSKAQSDTTAPSISLTTPPDGATYIKGAAVNAGYTCTDNVDPSPSCVGTNDGNPVANGSPIDISTVGQHTFTVTSKDAAGNPATVTHSYTVVYGAQLTSNTQAMDGDLKVAPGSVMSVGYDFTIPGSHPAATIGFMDAKVTFNVTCTAGTPSASTFTVPIADQSYPDPANSSSWYPSGDQGSASTYQGSAPVPTCSDPSGLIRLQQGGTFSTTVTSTAQVAKVNVRWHYKGQTGSGGGWSGTYSVTPH